MMKSYRVTEQQQAANERKARKDRHWKAPRRNLRSEAEMAASRARTLASLEDGTASEVYAAPIIVGYDRERAKRQQLGL